MKRADKGEREGNAQAHLYDSFDHSSGASNGLDTQSGVGPVSRIRLEHA